MKDFSEFVGFSATVAAFAIICGFLPTVVISSDLTLNGYHREACAKKCTSVKAKPIAFSDDDYCSCTNGRVYRRNMAMLYGVGK